MGLFQKLFSFVYYVFCVLFFFITGCSDRKEPDSQRSPSSALASFEIAEGFQIELVAAEPLVSDPVAMEIDELGNVYVVEMHGYPLDKSRSGRIKLLTDTNNDGVFDKSIVFADQLMLPTGIMRWKKGVLVTDAPALIYLEDTDKDGRADKLDTVLTGFALSNPQHNLNTPVYGPDNWIYLAHEPAVSTKSYQKEFGDRGTDVFFKARPDGPRLADNAMGRSVRIKPDEFKLESLSGYSQFGQTFDPWGHHFQVSNWNHIFHEVIGYPYLARNPDLLVSGVTENVSDHRPNAEIFAITRNPEHQLLTDIGVFTSACGLTWYNGGLFPDSFNHVSFVAEPVNNLIHADRVRDKGVSFTASRVYPDKEFLASTDPWFRPVNMYVGPDGALYVLDYYRQYIEHPEWMAEEVVKSGALYNGTDKGRIYRITPAGTAHADWNLAKELGRADVATLVSCLSHKNGWWRRNAQRLLIDKKDSSVVDQLLRIAESDPSPLARFHSLWTLEGLHALTVNAIVKALRDREARIRENGIRLAEQRLDEHPELAEALLTLSKDPDPKVRYRLLLALGYVNSDEVRKISQEMLMNDINDPWMQMAALSAPYAAQSGLLNAVITNYRKSIPAYGQLISRLTAMTAKGSNDFFIHELLDRTLKMNARDSISWQPHFLSGLTQTLKNRKTPFVFTAKEQELLYSNVFDLPVEYGNRAIELIKLSEGSGKRLPLKYLTQSIRLISDRQADPDRRALALEFLSLSGDTRYSELYRSMLSAKEPVQVQLAALRSLATLPDSLLTASIEDGWRGFTAEMRDASVSSLLGNESRMKYLLAMLESGKMESVSIAWPRRVQLMNHRNDSIRNRARSLFTKVDEKKEAIMARYREAMEEEGNASAGKQVFMQHCSICHQYGGKDGISFGPDLAGLRNRRPESVMTDILNPNLSIADGYDVWTIQTKSGEGLQGIIASETPGAITIKNYGGKEMIISRNDIAEIKSPGMSAMPEGLDKQITPQQMRDLVAFIVDRR